MVKLGESGLKILTTKLKQKLTATKFLLVDGHNSHYTVKFLTYAVKHDITVLCYPSHCTHIYQGLDVVIFSPLKKYWQEEHDREECENGKKVSKSNFLSVYALAHL